MKLDGVDVGFGIDRLVIHPDNRFMALIRVGWEMGRR